MVMQLRHNSNVHNNMKCSHMASSTSDIQRKSTHGTHGAHDTKTYTYVPRA